MAARSLRGTRPWLSQGSAGAQARDELPLERATSLDVKGLVDRLVADPHGLIIGEVEQESTGDLLRTPGRDAQIHAGLVAELDTARDLEYAEVLERLPTLIAELALERERGRGRGRLTFEEVEESEVDLARFVAWVERIAARDYFGAPLRSQVDLALTEATQALRDFEAAALIALALVLFAFVLAASDRLARNRRGLDSLTARDAVVLGFAQALALVPGVSRSGGTISAGLLLGLRR